MTAVPDSDRAAVLDALRSLPPGEEADRMRLFRLTGLNSTQVRSVLELLVADGDVEARWTGGNPSVCMYRVKEGS